jgi:DNA-directed RNA polymerase subunit RPC12/RpoP
MATGEAGGEREDGEEGPVEVLLLVCMNCGREYQFEAGEDPPEDLECEKCGGEVFRRFDDAAVPNEAQAEFREETERDMSPDDAEGDATRADLHDLNP